jgi:hypothetical protein
MEELQGYARVEMMRNFRVEKLEGIFGGLLGYRLFYNTR